jgi:hypothetical protein
MVQVVPGRFTAPSDTDVTVFLIGMRVNKPWRVDRWLPIIADMTRMQIHLAKHPEAGMLHAENWFGRTTLMLSYWKDPQSLQSFAADQESPHLEPWRRFMRQVAKSDAVGVWHETYVVPAGHSEVIYSTMPVFGLAAATSHVQIGRGTGRARERLGEAAMARTDSAPH